jgi:hypothetical protein
VLTIISTQNDKAFEKLQENFDKEAARSSEQEKEAYNQRAELRIQLAKVQDQLTPFVEIARARHPGLGDEAALERLSKEVKSLRDDSERISSDLDALRRFASVAQLGPLGVTGMAGAGLKESTPISRVLEGAYLQRDGRVFPRCDKQSLEKFTATATGHPDFPFSHYALAVCNKRLGSDEWKRHAERAASIFSQTVRIAGHNRSHDQAYAELKTYLEEGR